MKNNSEKNVPSLTPTRSPGEALRGNSGVGVRVVPVARMERSVQNRRERFWSAKQAPKGRTPGKVYAIRGIGPGFHFISSGLQKQRGISMVVVIFLLAVVSVMTLSMMNLSGTQHISSMYTVRGAQAYFAARSGMEYAVAQLVGGATCAGVANQVINGFNVNIACAAAGTYDEGNAAAPYTIYRVTTTAGDGTLQVPDVINRQLTVTVKTP